MKTLVVFYSRTGRTREVGHRIAAALHADLEEIADRLDRRGLVGYLRSGREAWFARRTRLMPVVRDPSAYDLVVVGTPVWNTALSSPVRTYLQDQREKFHAVAFFCTLGRIGSDRVFEQMIRESGKHPVATLAVRERDVPGPELPVAIRAFTYRMKTHRYAA